MKRGGLYAGDGRAVSFSCKPEDVMFARESMRERYVFTDVQLRAITVLCVGERVGSAADLTSKWR